MRKYIDHVLHRLRAPGDQYGSPPSDNEQVAANLIDEMRKILDDLADVDYTVESGEVVEFVRGIVNRSRELSKRVVVI